MTMNSDLEMYFLKRTMAESYSRWILGSSLNVQQFLSPIQNVPEAVLLNTSQIKYFEKKEFYHR